MRTHRTAGGIHVVSTDSAERALMIASVRASGFAHRRDANEADLILIGAAGTSLTDLTDRVAKSGGIAFALTGDDIKPDLLDAAVRAGATAILPRATIAVRFRAALRCAVDAARELKQLRRRAVETGDIFSETHDPLTPIEAGSSPTEPGEAGTRGAEPASLARSLMRERLTQALKNIDQHVFELFYQPKVNADTRAVVGFEALVRWDDPVCGAVSPAVFIPEVEEMGLIDRLGEWCIQEACTRAAYWTGLGLDPGRVAVNASPVQFQRVDFARWLIETVQAAGLDLRQFELEITEGCLCESEEAIATLRELSDAGVHVAIDDFGTGYSSLQYLRNLPVHCLKIDRVFVTDLETDASARSLTAAIISLAWNLGFRVVAEGVEDDFQWSFLADHGCDEIQGFRYSQPLSHADAEQLLRAEKARDERD